MTPENFRLNVAKIRKDFEKGRNRHMDLVEEVARLQASVGIPQPRHGRHNEEEEERERGVYNGGVGGGQTQIQFSEHKESVEAAIMREREEEIRSINSNMRLVNEMVHDLATVVSQQQELVDEIEDNAEQAHQRAEEGLGQIQKASDIQPTCLLS